MRDGQPTARRPGLVNKLTYHVRGIGRGDVVVFSGQGSWGALHWR